MTLVQRRRIDRIEVVYPSPGAPLSDASLQVRFVDDIVDDETQEVAAVKGYHREAYDAQGDLSAAPIDVQAAAAAMAAFQAAHPSNDGVVE